MSKKELKATGGADNIVEINLGSNARVRGAFERLNVGDSSEIDFSEQ